MNTVAPHPDSAEQPVLPPVWGRSLRPGRRAGSPAQRLRARIGYARSGDHGFTLVEAIVSFGIFAMVSGAATLAIITGVRSDNDTSDRVGASQLAQQETDRARAMPRASLTASPTTTSTQVVGNQTYTVTRTVTYLNNIGACPAASATPTAVSKMNVAVTVTVPGETTRTVAVNSVLAC